MKTQRPGLKWMLRSDRLSAAKKWAETYKGKRLVKGYSKHFGVDMICAITELKMVSVPIDPEYEKAIRASVQARIDEKKKLSENKALAESQYGVEFGNNEDLSFIAGFTDGGAAYGVPNHEAAECENNASEAGLIFKENNYIKQDMDFASFEHPDNELPF